eukprot:211236_1
MGMQNYTLSDMVLVLSFIVGACAIYFIVVIPKRKKHIQSQIQNTYRVVTERLKPNEDLAIGLESIVRREKITACNVVSCVGSVTSAELRMAHPNEIRKREEHFEIVSLTGTLEWNPKTDKVTRHLHIALSDKTGACWGGHVLSIQEDGNSTLKSKLPIYTTAEICLLVQNDIQFTREHCVASGWPELIVRKCC